MTDTGHKLIDVRIPGESMSLREFDYETLDSAIERLQRIRDNNPGKTMTLRVEQESYSDYEYWQLFETRRETDAERDARLAEENAQRRQQEARERAELERLQAKFK